MNLLTKLRKYFATPKEEASTLSALIYFTAGPLTAFPPISGEIAMTLSLFCASTFRRSARDTMGPILETGFAGAITTAWHRLMASRAAGFAVALLAFSYLMPVTLGLPLSLTQNSCRCISPIVLVTMRVITSFSVAGMI